jgi:hypothetical protein
MAPSTQLPGSIFFYLITVALLAFFAYSAYVIRPSSWASLTCA